MMRNALLLTLILCVALCAAPAVAQTTIQVNIGATPAVSGTNLLNALAGIVGNSAAKPFVLKVNPGIYDVGATPVAMKPFVDIEGSGQASTTLRGVGNDIGFLTAVVLGANNSELRNIRVLSLGRGFSNSIAVLLNNVSTSVRDVTLVSNGASGANWGLRNLSAASTLQNLTVSAGGGSQSYGIAFTGGTPSVPTLRRAVLQATGASSAHGIYVDQNAKPAIRDVEITASGTANSYGIRYAYGADLSGAILEVTNAKIVAAGGSVAASGIEVTGNENIIALTHSNVSALSGGGSSYGLRYESVSSAPVFRVDHCDIGGGTNSVRVPASSARFGNSKLAGPANIGAPTCVFSFNGNYVALSSTCL